MPRGKIKWATKQAVIERDGPHCRYCGVTARWGWRRDAKGHLRPWIGPPLSLDHVVPVILGGDDSVDNLVVACEPCNRRKFTGPAPALLPSRPVSFLPRTFANVVRDDYVNNRDWS